VLASARESINVADFSGQQQFNSPLLSYRLSENLFVSGGASRRESYQRDGYAASPVVPSVAPLGGFLLNNWTSTTTSLLTGSSNLLGSYNSLGSNVGGYCSTYRQDECLFTNPELLMECRMIIQQRNKKIQDIVAGTEPAKMGPINPFTPAFIGQPLYPKSSAQQSATYTKQVEGATSTINVVDTIEVR